MDLVPLGEVWKYRQIYLSSRVGIPGCLHIEVDHLVIYVISFITTGHYPVFSFKVLMHAKCLQSCPTLYDPTYCSPPGSSFMEFSRKEHWSGLPFPSPGDLPNPGIEPLSLTSPMLGRSFFTTSTTWEAQSSPIISEFHFRLVKGILQNVYCKRGGWHQRVWEPQIQCRSSNIHIYLSRIFPLSIQFAPLYLTVLFLNLIGCSLRLLLLLNTDFIAFDYLLLLPLFFQILDFSFVWKPYSLVLEVKMFPCDS